MSDYHFWYDGKSGRVTGTISGEKHSLRSAVAKLTKNPDTLGGDGEITWMTNGKEYGLNLSYHFEIRDDC